MSDLRATYSSAKRAILQNKWARSGLMLLAIVVLSVGSGFGYAYASSPANVRTPQFEHLHFRMQLSVDGKAVDFADSAFQQGYSADNCNVALTINPFHFHDNKDQFVHVHWKHMTGGELLKFYGWNRIGGVDGMLGYRFDKGVDLQPVQIHGTALPELPGGDNFYVYTGDEHSYHKRDLSEFLNQDFEKFFGQASSVHDDDQASLLDKLFPKAYAHHDEAEQTAMPMVNGQMVHHTDAELKRLNNLIGNVVIFVQKKAPSDADVKAKFDHLLPLSESACAG